MSRVVIPSRQARDLHHPGREPSVRRMKILRFAQDDNQDIKVAA